MNGYEVLIAHYHRAAIIHEIMLVPVVVLLMMIFYRFIRYGWDGRPSPSSQAKKPK